MAAENCSNQQSRLRVVSLDIMEYSSRGGREHNLENSASVQSSSMLCTRRETQSTSLCRNFSSRKSRTSVANLLELRVKAMGHATHQHCAACTRGMETLCHHTDGSHPLAHWRAGVVLSGVQQSLCPGRCGIRTCSVSGALFSGNKGACMHSLAQNTSSGFDNFLSSREIYSSVPTGRWGPDEDGYPGIVGAKKRTRVSSAWRCPKESASGKSQTQNNLRNTSEQNSRCRLPYSPS
jgi:hypothetical protein